MNQLKIDGLAKSSVLGILRVLSAAYEYAIEPLQYVRENPCARIKLPKFEKAAKTALCYPTGRVQKDSGAFSGRQQFLSAAYDWLLYRSTSQRRPLRCAGMISTWISRTLSVKKTVVKRNYGVDVRKVLEQKGTKEEKSAWYFGTPKTVNSIRTIKFGDALYKALKACACSHRRRTGFSMANIIPIII